LDKLDIQTDIRDLEEPIWKERSRENQKKEKVTQDSNENISDAPFVLLQIHLWA